MPTTSAGRGPETVEPAILPSGTYWVGDPCYTVPSDRWHEWLEAAYATTHQFADELLLAKLDRYPIVGVRTQHGDGTYVDQEGHEYDVDAGLIGLVPVAVAQPRYLRCNGTGQLVTFDTPVVVSRSSNGVITLGHIVIDTGRHPWLDEDDEDW